MALTLYEAFAAALDDGFKIGQVVQWTDDAPKSWSLIHALFMTIVSKEWRGGEVSDYARRFGIEEMEPGWVYEVTFNNDWYYDPPLEGCIIQVHGMWLKEPK